MPYQCNWGIISTGWIAQQFSHDLLISPATRGADDLDHRIVAVASRTKSKAQAFVEKLDVPYSETIETYGSYSDLYANERVDVCYIGTPHSHHYANVFAALTSGKNVLVEKPMAVTAEQARVLVDLAREKKCFLMEAVWTRFQPYAAKLREVLQSGVIGEIRAAQSELCVDFHSAEPTHRLLNPDLAGGALLDLGPYPWTQLCLALRAKPQPSDKRLQLPELVASMTKTSTGVDASVVATIKFVQANGKVVHGTMTAAQNAQSAHSRVLYVQGSHGFMETQWPTFRPSSFRYEAWDSPEDYAAGDKPPTRADRFEFGSRPGDIWGFAWEADAVARSLRDGKLESEHMPLNETLLMMEVFDEMRKQGGLLYPESLETADASVAPS
ncbi:hypothetical protein JCM16303_005176 [Sporobolomyces ruberrimus]